MKTFNNISYLTLFIIKIFKYNLIKFLTNLVKINI